MVPKFGRQMQYSQAPRRYDKHKHDVRLLKHVPKNPSAAMQIHSTQSKLGRQESSSIGMLHHRHEKSDTTSSIHNLPPEHFNRRNPVRRIGRRRKVKKTKGVVICKSSHNFKAHARKRGNCPFEMARTISKRFLHDKATKLIMTRNMSIATVRVEVAGLYCKNANLQCGQVSSHRVRNNKRLV